LVFRRIVDRNESSKASCSSLRRRNCLAQSFNIAANRNGLVPMERTRRDQFVHGVPALTQKIWRQTPRCDAMGEKSESCTGHRDVEPVNRRWPI